MHDWLLCSWLDSFRQDLGYAFRLFRRNPSLTLSAVVTLAVGIGANTAIFTAARGILLRPLPYAAPERLLMVWQGDKNRPAPVRGFATPIHAIEWRARNASFTDIAIFEPWAARPLLRSGDRAEYLKGTYASPNFFDLLGVTAEIGRTFSENDARRGSNDLIVVSHALWRSRFQSNSAAVGRSLDLTVGRDRTTGRFTVIGILPERFRFTYPEETQVWFLRTWSEVERSGPLNLQYNTIARLKPGVSLDQAAANMVAVADSMVRDLPDKYSSFRSRFQAAAAEDTIYLEPIQEYVLGKTRPALILLTVATVFLLFVACANVATLLMARTVQRSRELSLRVALGAARRRLSQQLLTEGLVIGAAGGLAGLLLAMLLQPILQVLLPATYPRVDEITVDAAAIFWTASLAVAAAIVAGLAPSWRRLYEEPHAVLKQSAVTATSARSAVATRHVLVAIQVALVALLMLGGGLLVRTLWNLRRVDLGFDGTNVLAIEMRMMETKYRNPQTLRLFEQALLNTVRALPGVQSASIASAIPMRGTDTLVAFTTAAGQRYRVNHRVVDPFFFDVLRIPLLSGRVFEAVESEDVVVLSESAAALLFPSSSAIGEVLEIPLVTKSSARVIGIVADVRYQKVEEPAGPAIYVPRHQSASSIICLIVRSSQVTGISESVRRAVHALDPWQPVEGVTTLDTIVAAAIADRRFYAIMTVAFSLAGLMMAIAGLYGVVSRSVTERIRELGIRMALGASRTKVFTLILRQALLPVAAGLGGGALLAVWSTTLLRRFLFGVSTMDPTIYVTVPLAIILIAMVASLLPANRASRIEPIEALRSE